MIEIKTDEEIMKVDGLRRDISLLKKIRIGNNLGNGEIIYKINKNAKSFEETKYNFQDIIAMETLNRTTFEFELIGIKKQEAINLTRYTIYSNDLRGMGEFFPAIKEGKREYEKRDKFLKRYEGKFKWFWRIIGK